nr:MAG TPA: hypothetical protein [Caudoviricetes sp.]
MISVKSNALIMNIMWSIALITFGLMLSVI